VIEGHEWRTAAVPFDHPKAPLEVGGIGGGGEVSLVAIVRPKPALQPLGEGAGFMIFHTPKRIV
jgi:hypothetical protein